MDEDEDRESIIDGNEILAEEFTGLDTIFELREDVRFDNNLGDINDIEDDTIDTAII